MLTALATYFAGNLALTTFLHHRWHPKSRKETTTLWIGGPLLGMPTALVCGILVGVLIFALRHDAEEESWLVEEAGRLH